MSDETVTSYRGRRVLYGSLEQLALLRDFIRQAVRECGGGEEDAFACELACDEAATNIFRHDFEGKPGKIEVNFEGSSAVIEIRLHYRGKVFDPSRVPEPDLALPPEERPAGGLGLYFMRQVMDEIVFQFDAVGGNVLTMRRFLNLQERYGMMELTIERPSDDSAVIHVQGSVDGSNFKQLTAQAEDLYEGGVRKIVLELSGCEYMSSSGLVALNAIAKLLQGENPPDTDNGWALLKTLDDARALQAEPHLALVNPSTRVDRVLDMAGMKAYLPIYSDTASALAALG